jgi:hypothetical protein
MAVNITIQSGEDSHFAPAISRLPSEIEVERPDGSPLALIFIPVTLFIAYQVLLALAPASALPGTLLATIALGAAGWLWWRQNGKPHVIRLERDGVVVAERGMLGVSRWQARYDEFDGLMMRRLSAASPTGRTTYEVIELRHPDPRKTLPLYAVRSPTPPRERWQELAGLLGVPALQSDQQL